MKTLRIAGKLKTIGLDLFTGIGCTALRAQMLMIQRILACNAPILTKEVSGYLTVDTQQNFMRFSPQQIISLHPTLLLIAMAKG